VKAYHCYFFSLSLFSKEEEKQKPKKKTSKENTTETEHVVVAFIEIDPMEEIVH
jgi:hypothetical protein